MQQSITVILGHGVSVVCVCGGGESFFFVCGVDFSQDQVIWNQKEKKS